MSNYQNTSTTSANTQQVQPIDLFQKQTKLLKKQLIHGRIRTIIMVLILAVFVISAWYMKAKIDEAMTTVASIYTMTQNVNSLAEEVSELTINVSETVDKLDTDEINVVISNMSSVSESLKGSVEALNVDGLNEAVSNMNDVAENLNSVATLLNGAADALSSLFGK